MRGLGHPSLQGLDLVLKLLDLALELRHLCLELSDLPMLVFDVVLHGRRGGLPLKLGKGQCPQGRVVMRLRGSGLAHQGSYRWRVWAVTLIGRKASKL